uniref:LCCL domain-containing protein n=1 Tax=Strongyloides papillosus TaxID=174720 RepID=A0A0N5BMA7_STREA
MKRTELLFFLILVYFTITNHNVIGKKKSSGSKNKKSSSTAYVTSMNKLIEYYIPKTLNEEVITDAHNLMQNVSCLNFTRTLDGGNLNATVFRWQELCHASVEIANNHIVYTINMNADCEDKSRISKMIFWSANMRYQINNCIKDKPKYQQGSIQEVMIKDILDKTKLPKGKEGIEYDHFEHKDYSKDISFSAIKDLNQKICSDSCKGYPYTKCFNYGMRYPKECPQIYTRKITLDFKSECYYRIKPKHKNRKIVVRFKPHDHFKYDCRSPKLLEARHFQDKSKVGVIPCGNIKSFAVKSKKSKDVLVYHRKIEESLKITMEYKLV